MNIRRSIAISFLAIILSGCAAISHFDQNSYASAMKLKADTLALVPKAIEPASKHASEIDALKSALSAQLAYEEGKGKANTISHSQWRILMAEDKELLGGFLKRWQSGKQLNKAYVDEKAIQISDGFDQILKLEGAKPK